MAYTVPGRRALRAAARSRRSPRTRSARRRRRRATRHRHRRPTAAGRRRRRRRRPARCRTSLNAIRAGRDGRSRSRRPPAAGVAKVEFLLGDRLVCTVTAAPYTLPRHAPRRPTSGCSRCASSSPDRNGRRRPCSTRQVLVGRFRVARASTSTIEQQAASGATASAARSPRRSCRPPARRPPTACARRQRHLRGERAAAARSSTAAGRLRRRLHRAAALHREAQPARRIYTGERPLRRATPSCTPPARPGGSHEPCPLRGPRRSRSRRARALAAAAPAPAYVDPPGCTQEVAYDLGIPTFKERRRRRARRRRHRLDAAPPDRRRSTRTSTRWSRPRRPATAREGDPQVVRHLGARAGPALLRRLVAATTSTTSTRAAPTGRSGRASRTARSPRRPASRRSTPARRFGWITATPHGGEAAAAEAISRMLYELAARTDCWNLRRLRDDGPVPDAGPQPGRARRAARRRAHVGLGVRPQPRLRHPEPGRERRVPAAAQAVPGPVLHRRPPADRRATSSRPTRTRSTTRSRTSRSTSSRTGSARRCSRSSTTRAPRYRNYNTLRPLRPGVRRLRAVAAQRRGRHDVREGHERGLRQAGLRPLPRDRRDGQRDRPRQGRAARATGRGSGRRRSTRARPARCSRTSWSARCSDDDPTRGAGRTCGSAATSTGPDNHAGDTAELIRHMQRQGVHVLPVRPRRRRSPACASSAQDGGVAAHAARRDALHPDGPAAQALDPGRARRGPVPAAQLLLRRRAVVVLAAARPERQRLPHRAPARRAR